MGSASSSKKNEVPSDSNCSTSMKVRMARGAGMAVNPAAALITRAIMSHKSHNKKDSDDDGC